MNGRPLLSLTPKMITLRELRFSERERTVYDQLYVRGRDACHSYGLQAHGTRGRKSGEQDAVFGFTRVLVVLLRLRQLCDHRSLIAASAEGQQIKGMGGAPKRDRSTSLWLRPTSVGQSMQRMQFDSMEELVNMVLDCCQAHVDGIKAIEASSSIVLTARVVWSVLESACGGISIDQVKTLIRPALTLQQTLDEVDDDDEKLWAAEVDMDALADSLTESDLFEYREEKKIKQEKGKLSQDKDLWDPLYASTKVYFIDRYICTLLIVTSALY